MVNETTLKQYRYYIKRLRKETGEKDIFKTDVFIPAVHTLRQEDGGEMTPTTLRNYFIALTYMTKIIPAVSAKYKAEYQKINKALKTAEPDLTPPPMSWDEYQSVGLSIMGEEDIPLEDRILMGFLTQIVPLRLDLAGLAIFPNAPKHYEGNYVRLGRSAKTSKLVIQKHKTERTYGALKRDIPEPLFGLLKQWRALNPEGQLFEMSDNTMGKYIARLFEKYTDTHTTQNTLRHAYVSEARKGDRSKKEVEAIAHELGHSLAMNYDYRRD